MSNAVVYVCDAVVAAAGASLFPGATAGVTVHSCPAQSRAAATDVVLREVAARDGWVRDGSKDLCPFHALEATP